MGLSGLFGFMTVPVTYPVRTHSKWVDHLKVTNDYRLIHFPQHINYDDPDILDKLIDDHDVVVNLIGAGSWLKNYDFIYDSNVTMAKRIAEASAKSPYVKRFIHVSAVGVDPHSNSTRLSTKWLGEQEVKNAYPDATIIRPTTIFGEYDNFITRWAKL